MNGQEIAMICLKTISAIMWIIVAVLMIIDIRMERRKNKFITFAGKEYSVCEVAKQLEKLRRAEKQMDIMEDIIHRQQAQIKILRTIRAEENPDAIKMSVTNFCQADDDESVKQVKIKNGVVLFKKGKDLVLYTTETVWDADTKTAQALNKPCIPKGTAITVEDIFQNLYGKWVQTTYEGFNYSINPKSLEYRNKTERHDKEKK